MDQLLFVLEYDRINWCERDENAQGSDERFVSPRSYG